MSERTLEGKVGLVFGVANKRSIAWGIAQAWAKAGAKLIFSYQGERLKANLEELIEDLGQNTPFYPCDVSSDESITEFFQHVRTHTDRVDLVLHSVAFAPKEALEGDFLSTSREAFRMSHDVSAYSLVALARESAPLMIAGGSIVAMSYHGSTKVVPRYNVMGVAKASLESAARYLAYDLGRQKVRVNCISAGPMNTLAARGISGLNLMMKHYQERAPLNRSCTLEELGATGVFLASDGAASITGQVLYVDGGYEIMGMLKTGAFGSFMLVVLAAGTLAGPVPSRAGEASAGEVAGGPMPSYDFFHPAPADKLRDFNPDRPSRFTGPFTVDPGHVQLEMDLANDTLDRHNPEHARVDVDQWNSAPFDLRIGLTSRTEIDLIYDGYLNLRTNDHAARTNTVQSGFGDLTLLFKYNLFGDDGGTFSFGILPYLKIPTNTANLGNKRVEGGVILPLSVNLPANFQLGIQTEFDAIRNDADTRFEPAFTNIAYLGYTFLDKKLTVYGEWYSQVNVGPDSEVDGEVDAGLIFYVGKSAEVDFGCNFGVTRAAPDFEPFAGVSVRF